MLVSPGLRDLAQASKWCPPGSPPVFHLPALFTRRMQASTFPRSFDVYPLRVLVVEYHPRLLFVYQGFRRWCRVFLHWGYLLSTLKEDLKVSQGRIHEKLIGAGSRAIGIVNDNYHYFVSFCYFGSD